MDPSTVARWHHEVHQLGLGLAKRGEPPFASLIVRNGTLLGSGLNRVLTSNDPTAHSEILAIQVACNNLRQLDLSDCVLFTTAEPCLMCVGAILWAGIETIYFQSSREVLRRFGFNDGADPATGRDVFRLNQRRTLQLEPGLLPDLFSIWHSHPQRMTYAARPD